MPQRRPQRGRWIVRHILDEPAGDHNWASTADVDLAAPDAAGTAVIRITAFRAALTSICGRAKLGQGTSFGARGVVATCGLETRYVRLAQALLKPRHDTDPRRALFAIPLRRSTGV